MAEPLRVLYFVSNYHRFTGSQRSLFLLLRALDRAEVEPLVVFPGDGACSRAYEAAGLRVRIERPPPVLDQFGGKLLRTSALQRARLAATAVAPYTLRLARLMRRDRIDIAHLNNTRAMLMAAPAARLVRVPTVWHVRSDESIHGAFFLNVCGALASRIICVADGVHFSIPAPFRHKCRTVYNGIDPPKEPPTRTRAELLASLDPPLEAGEGDMLVVVVGSLVPFKGAHHLVEALARLREADPARAARVRTVFVGDRPDAEYGTHLDAIIASRSVQNVRFAGWDDMPLDWTRAADVVCLPTVHRERLELSGRGVRNVFGTEGFSRTVLEAMASARPVIASRVSGVPEQVVDRETGVLVEPSNAGSLAQALIEMLDVGRAQRASMGEAAFHRVGERFSVRAMADDTLGVYREIGRVR